MHPARKAEIDRLADLANLGAEQAAESFTQLVGRTIRTDAPTVIDADSSGGAGRSDEKISTSSTGVFFEFEGCLEALVGIVFPASASEALVRRVIGIESGELMPTVIESALMEVGNILASHVASGIADALKSRLLPSIPSLAMENSEQALESFIEGIAGPNALRIESAFSDDGGEIRGRFVLVPTQVAHWAPLQQGSDSRDL
jgi:chemotaxis protein CheY-P-specific phosphatase CheC